MKELLKQLIGIKGMTILRLIISKYKSKEEKNLIKLRKHFYSQFIDSDDDIFFDVGANFGNRIEPIVDQGIKIIAIEPQIECVEFLNKKYNGNITVVQKGLGEFEEVKTMYLSNTSTLSSFSKSWIEATKASGRFSGYKWDKKRQISITTLDALISLYGKPKFIKIDVEGYELEVLKGLSQPIEYISFEYAMPEAKETILNCIDRIVEISPKNQVQFNYSVREDLKWALKQWINPQQMKEVVYSHKFAESKFGDVYSKIQTQSS